LGRGVEVFDDYTLGCVTAATRKNEPLKARASPLKMQCCAAAH
jgi:hypothetical protein